MNIYKQLYNDYTDFIFFLCEYNLTKLIFNQ